MKRLKMTDDIVTRLRDLRKMLMGNPIMAREVQEAMDEIERLRAELDSYKSSSKRLSNGPIPNKPSLKTKQTNGGAW